MSRHFIFCAKLVLVRPTFAILLVSLATIAFIPSKTLASSLNRNNDTNSDASDSSLSEDQNYPDSLNDSSLKPVITRVIRFNSSEVLVAWDIQDSNEVQVQYFKVQYLINKKNSTVKTDDKEIGPNSRGHHLSRLKPGEYKFRVIAVYDFNDSVGSEDFKYKLKSNSKVNTSEYPSKKAPVISWNETTSNVFQCKWTYDKKVTDNDTGYVVYYRPVNTISEYTIYTTQVENVEIYLLDSDTFYEAKILAFNKVGVSNATEIKFKTKSKNYTSSNSQNTVSLDVIKTTIPSEPTTESDITDSTIAKTTVAPTTPPTQIPTTILPQTTTTITTTQSPVVIVPTNSSFFYIFVQSMHYDFKMDDNINIKIGLVIIISVILLIITGTVVSCFKKKKQLSSIGDPLHFDRDLEINVYFKNSFPDIE